MDDIRNWFNTGKKYADGVKLYLQHGKDPLLTRLFTAEGYSDFKMKKLTSALDEMITPRKPVAPIAKPHEKKPDPSPAITTPESKWRKNRDSVEESLYQKWKPIFLEMQNLVARIGDVARAGVFDASKEQEAGRMALRILDLDDECDILYYNRDHYQQHGKMPLEEKPMEISLDHLLWPKRLANHKRYVRKFTNDLKKDPSNITAAEYLQKHEWAVAEYEKLLKMHHAV